MLEGLKLGNRINKNNILSRYSVSIYYLKDRKALIASKGYLEDELKVNLVSK